MKKRVGILLTLVSVMCGAISINATEVRSCPYASTHGKHNPHASTMECKTYIWPDYTMGQMHQQTFWKSTGCNYVCCIIDEYFGNLITNLENDDCSK